MRTFGLSGLMLLAIVSVYPQDLSIEEKKEFPRNRDFVVEAEFSPFRNYFALARRNNIIEIYDRNWDEVFSHQGNPESYGGNLAFSPDEKYLAYGKYKGDNDIAIIRLKDMKVIQTLRGHSYFVSDLRFSNDGNYLVSVSGDKSMIVWKLDGDHFEKQTVHGDYDNSVRCARFSFDDLYLLTADDDGYVCVYKRQNDSYELSERIKCLRAYIYSLDYNPLKHEFLVGASSKFIRFRLGDNGFSRVDSLRQGVDARNGITYSPDGSHIAIPYSQRLQIFRNGNNGLTKVDGIYRHSNTVLGASFSSDGQFMATWAVDSILVIWEIDPFEPSKKTLISSWVDDKLTPAQRRILTWDVVSDLYNRVDKGMVSPRDEFETTEEYNKRRDFLSDWTLSLIQNKVEELYNIRETDDSSVRIPVQNLLGYNADLRIYKILFLETEAGVSIPINEAKQFKQKWERAYIRANKVRTQGKRSYEYSNFQLVIPGTSSSFDVTPLENPFHLDENLRQGKAYTGVETTTEVSLAETPLTDDGVISHAILFGTNIYDSFSDLVNPVLDANTIGAELSKNFGVNTEVVINPTLKQTVEKIREYATREYTDNENLIIFFAGHGVYDEIFKEGYVISSDSKADDIGKTSYLSHSNLRTMVNNIDCEHIFLVMDVCFGGTFDPSLAKSAHRGEMEMYSDIPREEFISRKQKYKTRLYLTSGGKEYVPDGRSGFHSPFARRFIEALRKYGGEDGVLTTGEILQFVEKVNPQPRFGEFGDNEPGSDFILIAK